MNVQETLDHIAKYSVKINSKIIHDLLHDYLDSGMKEVLKVPKNKLHIATTYIRLINLLANKRFRNKLILLENETHFLFVKINYSDLLKGI